MLISPGDKSYFAKEGLISETVVGGVTLNHLSWARALGVPTALLALQGEDANGIIVREKLGTLGVDTSFIRASSKFTTSVSHILSDAGSGERTILMNPASTSRMDGALIAREWAAPLAARAAMVSTEISQLPLSGVEALIDAAARAGAPSILDVDVPPSVATGAAQLGPADALARCVRKANVVKLTGSAVEELLALLAPGTRAESSLEGITQQLADVLACRLVVITDGSKGSALAVGRAAGGSGTAVRVPSFPGVVQRDATGAGDAYLGGIIAALYARGSGMASLPTSGDDLVAVGRIASAAGAACVEVVGALPVQGVSAARMAVLCPEAARLVAAADALTAAAAVAAAAAPEEPASAGGHVQETPRDAFLSSLLEDSEALGSLSATYALSLGGTSDAALRELVAALMSARSVQAPLPAPTGGAAAPAAGAPAALAGAAGVAAGAAGASAAAVTPASGGSGVVYTSGMGKAGAVAARLALSLRSLGVRSSFVHGSEWVHGDLGAAGKGDAVVFFSHSGRTAELLDASARVSAAGARVFAITGSPGSPLAKAASGSGGHLAATAEGELLGAVPSRSIVAQEAVATGLCAAFVAASGLTRAAFTRWHPGGAIGAGGAA